MYSTIRRALKLYYKGVILGRQIREYSPLICRRRASWNLILISIVFDAREISSLTLYFRIIEIVRGFEDLHQALVDIDAFREQGVFIDDIKINSGLPGPVHVGSEELSTAEHMLDCIVELAVGDGLEAHNLR